MITLELEKRVALLTSVLDLGGRATKRSVLDNLDRRGYLALGSAERELKHNRDEEIWRNDIAFTRHHLVREGLMDGRIRDNWQITEAGKRWYVELAGDVADAPNLAKLTPAGRARACEHVARLKSQPPQAA